MLGKVAVSSDAAALLIVNHSFCRALCYSVYIHQYSKQAHVLSSTVVKIYPPETNSSAPLYTSATCILTSVAIIWACNPSLLPGLSLMAQYILHAFADTAGIVLPLTTFPPALPAAAVPWFIPFACPFLSGAEGGPRVKYRCIADASSKW